MGWGRQWETWDGDFGLGKAAARQRLCCRYFVCLASMAWDAALLARLAQRRMVKVTEGNDLMKGGTNLGVPDYDLHQ